jgi:hypothetical protein
MERLRANLICGMLSNMKARIFVFPSPIQTLRVKIYKTINLPVVVWM